MRDPEDVEGKPSRTDIAARADRRSHAHRGSGELRTLSRRSSASGKRTGRSALARHLDGVRSR